MNSDVPRFNHVAIGLSAEALDAPSQRALLDFYAEVFGWTEMPNMSVEGEQLVFRVHSNEQFVFLHASDSPMQGSELEHVGLQVSTPEALDAVVARARKYRERDADVEISERETRDFKAVVLHSVYIRYRLPMSIELQCYEWAPGFDAQRVS